MEKVKDAKSAVDILAMQKLVQEEREALVVRRLEEVAMRSSSRRIDPATFGYLIGSQSLMGYEPMAKWETDRPSKAQLDRLEEYGIDIVKVDCKGLACRLMDACIHRMRFRLASVHQLQALSAARIRHNPQRITVREANRLLTEVHLSAIKKAA
jgi:hypothetical protein